MSHRCWYGAAALLALLAGAAPLTAAILELGGAARTELREFRNNQPGDTARGSDTLPGTADAFPLQVAVRLAPVDAAGAAGAVAAQVSDPTTASGPNPEDFAINLALNSRTTAIRYECSAKAEEFRRVVFTADETGRIAGTTAPVRGRIYLDGAATLFAGESATDLRGASVSLSVVVVKETAGAADKVLLSGSVELIGRDDGAVEVRADGEFPTDTLVLSDLGGLADDRPVFHLLLLPALQIEYDYDAVIGEEFTLRATVQCEAANVDGAGAALVLGGPSDSLADVIGLTEGNTASGKLLGAIAAERAAPSGDLVFPQPPALGGICGALGLETAFGLFALAGLRACRTRRAG